MPPGPAEMYSLAIVNLCQCKKFIKNNLTLVYACGYCTMSGIVKYGSVYGGCRDIAYISQCAYHKI